MKTNDIIALPKTRLCRVVYTKGGMNYGRVMETPTFLATLQQVLLKDRIGWSQVQRIEAV